MKNVIKRVLRRKLVLENLQMAEKEYFSTGKLTQEDKDKIMSITNGDSYTKLMSDIYHTLELQSFNGVNMKDMEGYYSDAKSYDKNVYPIKDYDIYNTNDIVGLISAFKSRRNIIKQMRKLPSFAVRNMKDDIRKERDGRELYYYSGGIDYFMANYSLLSNRPKDIQEKILRKMFKNGATLENILHFIQDKENLIGGVEIDKEGLYRLSEDGDFDVIYDKGSVMILKVYSVDGIAKVGCNSLWCFTYGSEMNRAYREWYNFSHNGIVYVIVNLKESSDSSNFMYVLTGPIIDYDDEPIEYDEGQENPLYDMMNQNIEDPYSVISWIFGDGYMDVVREYLNFEN